MSISLKTRRRLVLHLLFWMVVQLILQIIHSSSITRPLENVLTGLLFLPYNMTLVYVALYWVLPPALTGQKRLFVSRLGVYLLGGWVLNFLYRAYVLVPFRTGKPALFPNYHQIFTIGAWVIGLVIVGVAIRIKLYLIWQDRTRANQQLTSETLLVELQVLKAQIHPHFLFNTLNNLYSLTLKQSPQTPDMVLKLSELLHYMIYECNTLTVPLAKEIAFLRNYIELEKLRYGHRLSVLVCIQSELGELSIAPLLLIPFVENAFKHGSSKQIGTAAIELRLTLSDKVLRFRLENSCDEQIDRAHKGNREMGGLGLPNVQKRLALLYPDAHSLTVLPKAGRYIVELTIDLDKIEIGKLQYHSAALQATY